MSTRSSPASDPTREPSKTNDAPGLSAQAPPTFDRKPEQTLGSEARALATSPVILFDGVCNLCNASVAFVMRHDRRQVFRFASLQSASGQRLLIEHGADADVARAAATAPAADEDGADAWQSMVMIDEDGVFRRSTAVLRVLRRLGLPWSIASVLLLLPVAIRDWGYTFIARRRYRWFGKRETCAIPTPEQRARFLE